MGSLFNGGATDNKKGNPKVNGGRLFRSTDKAESAAKKPRTKAKTSAPPQNQASIKIGDVSGSVSTDNPDAFIKIMGMILLVVLTGGIIYSLSAANKPPEHQTIIEIKSLLDSAINHLKFNHYLVALAVFISGYGLWQGKRQFDGLEKFLRGKLDQS